MLYCGFLRWVVWRISRITKPLIYLEMFIYQLVAIRAYMYVVLPIVILNIFPNYQISQNMHAFLSSNIVPCNIIRKKTLRYILSVVSIDLPYLCCNTMLEMSSIYDGGAGHPMCTASTLLTSAVRQTGTILEYIASALGGSRAYVTGYNKMDQAKHDNGA